MVWIGESLRTGLAPNGRSPTGFSSTLMKVRGAAAEVGLEAEEIRLRAVGRPGPLVHVHQNLVGLLIVLVRPHRVIEGQNSSR
jgi:hypothetical protein